MLRLWCGFWWWFVGLDLGESGLVDLDVGGEGAVRAIDGGAGGCCLAGTSAGSSLPAGDLAVALTELNAAGRGGDVSGDVHSIHRSGDLAGACDARALVAGLGSIIVVGGGVGKVGGIVLSGQVSLSPLYLDGKETHPV